MDKYCFNCRTRSAIEWKSGWPTLTGDLADLCDKCGNAYENNKFCEEFHAEVPGWRECCVCYKKLHCGCISSRLLIVTGYPVGVKCLSCAKDDPLPDATHGSENNSTGNRHFSLPAPYDWMLISLSLMKDRILSFDGSTVSILYVIQPYFDSYDFPRQNRERYWPKVTEEELIEIHRDPLCPIFPLFEKKLSVSDTRSSRLVLPKSCVESYFPDMSDKQGASLTFHDVNGRDWEFKFRVWANGNSKMYALDGVQTFLQSLELQANDTVTFSRKFPEGIFVLGFRKSPNPGVQDEAGGSNTEESPQLGSKNKRQQWTIDEAHAMLRPQKYLKPNIVPIDEYEFEEFDAPPVLGKQSVFAAASSGMVAQWTKCDICFKWRKLPTQVLLSDKWICAENVWDSARNFCDAPDESDQAELERLLYLTKGVRVTGLAMVDEEMKKAKASTEAIFVEELGMSTVATIPKPEIKNEELAISDVAITPKLEPEDEELAISAVATTPKPETESEVPHSP